MTNTITKEQIESLVNESVFTGTKLGQKTTVLHCVLPSGFEVVESSACVDPANYDQGMGESICKQRIVNRIWQLEGYRLQCELAAREWQAFEDKVIKQREEE